MTAVLLDEVQGLRDALKTAPPQASVTVSLSRDTAVLVLAFLETESATGALVVPVKSFFTSTEASVMLGMSRPTLMKLLEAGVIDHVLVGTHHRIPLRSIVDYQRSRQSERAANAAAVEEFRSNVTFRRAN